MSEPVSVRSCMHVLVGKITTGCDWCTGGGLSGAGRAASNTIRASESQKGEAGQSWTVCHMAARRHIYMHVDTHTHTTAWGLLSDRVRY